VKTGGLALLGAAGLAVLVYLLHPWWRVWLAGRPADNPTPAVAVAGTFEPAGHGAIISGPVVTPDRVYVAAVRDQGLTTSGVVYCQDRRGTVLWQFDDGGAMQHMICTPCLAAGRLYVGEGMHANDVCKLYCLDAASGRKLWDFTTAGHIESSPCVAAGAVFFGAGDDGLYCLDAGSGAERWHLRGPWHIDTGPAVAGGRVYAGSGVSRLNQTTEILCLGAADGKLLWRTPTELPVWGSPVVDGGQVFFGLGTGRLTQSAEAPEKPAGALLCADAATGRPCWVFPVADAVFGRAAVEEESVWFGARDGRCYCLDRRDGRPRWQADMGSPVVTRPALAGGRLYVVAEEGRVSCLDAGGGRALWTFDVAGHTQTRPQLLSSPVVVTEAGGGDAHHLLYFGAELRTRAGSTAMLYCLRD
jgi:outer membrane protein assembly factor BamB